MKYAFLTMEVEDWYHLDYFDRTGADQTYSLLDGIDHFAEVLGKYEIPATFFVLGELAAQLGPRLRALRSGGHEIASHGWQHRRPGQLSLPEFLTDASRSRMAIEDCIGGKIDGYRAPCFDLNPSHREGLPSAGFSYDNSLLFRQPPTKRMLDELRLHPEQPGIYRTDRLRVFEISTARMFGRQFPISSAGYFRLLPWPLMARAVRAYLATASVYVLYIHPFELSNLADPDFPPGTRRRDRIRFGHGRDRMRTHLEALIQLLRQSGFHFSTFARMCTSIEAIPRSSYS